MLEPEIEVLTKYERCARLRQKIKGLLKARPMTTRRIVEELRRERFLDYSFWAPMDLNHALKHLKKETIRKMGVGSNKWELV